MWRFQRHERVGALSYVHAKPLTVIYLALAPFAMQQRGDIRTGEQPTKHFPKLRVIVLSV